MTARAVAVGGIDLAVTLRPVALLPGDPSVRLTPGRFARASPTPEGPGALVVTWSDAERVAHVEGHGPGGTWLCARAEGLLGVVDNPCGFEPAGPPLRDLWRRHRGLRVNRTTTLWHDLAWLIVQQRVTSRDAADQWRRLVVDLGDDVDLGDGVDGVDGLVAPPAPAVLARLPYHRLHRYGIERRRADHLRAAALAAPRVQPLVDAVVDAPADGVAAARAAATAALRAVPGIGPWTAAGLAAQTWGDPDTAIVGDDGIPALVAWALAGERTADDARMLELLEPYRPHRYRVLRLVMAGGTRPPRRAPRGHRTDIRRR